MIHQKKPTKTYYFSVEGQTEKSYLEWLQQTINQDNNNCSNVKFDIKVEKNPISRVKRMSITQKTELFHLVDMEVENAENRLNFTNTLNKMAEAENTGKSIKYTLGYSNLTFELWIILHKCDCSEQIANPHSYLNKINSAFSKSFCKLSEFKIERNLKNVLNKLTITDVIEAIRRADRISEYNKEEYKCVHHKKYKYYQKNPSLSINEVIKRILIDTGYKI